MKIIITSGGTSEDIDKVRKITNKSSGRLGSIIANTFIEKFGQQIETLYYICAKNSIKPNQNKKIKEIYISSANSLYQTMKTILSTEKIDIVVHSMAVSDYTVDYVSSSEIFSKKLENKNNSEILSLLNSSSLKVDNSKKLSSGLSDMIIKLRPTKKIISYIKSWSKKTYLIGFKLLANQSKEELLKVANKLMTKNNCDLVVANDICDITENKHIAYIIDNKQNHTIAQNNQEIAEILCKKLKKEIKL